MRDYEKRKFALVRALLRQGSVRITPDGLVKVPGARGAILLPLDQIEELVGLGILGIAEGMVTCRPEARAWLRRRRTTAGEPFRAQHGDINKDKAGNLVDRDESPLSRLAALRAGKKPFLEPYQLEAGLRFRRLFERAQLRTRVTMSYSLNRTAGGDKGAGRPAEISDMAADARRELARLHTILPPECAGVALDVCGLEKGLELVERERGWPRRSAKLVLRIGLEQLARHFGLSPQATGRLSGEPRFWLDDRAKPELFG